MVCLGTAASTAYESRKPVEGKTVLTEISTNCRPIWLIFGTLPFLSMVHGMAMTDTLMAMPLMAMAIMAMIGEQFLHKSPPISD